MNTSDTPIPPSRVYPHGYTCTKGAAECRAAIVGFDVTRADSAQRVVRVWRRGVGRNGVPLAMTAWGVVDREGKVVAVLRANRAGAIYVEDSRRTDWVDGLWVEGEPK